MFPVAEQHVSLAPSSLYYIALCLIFLIKAVSTITGLLLLSVTETPSALSSEFQAGPGTAA